MLMDKQLLYKPRAVRPIAFFLPQFHPIPENDAAWGKGFTEWINVTRARPQFTGHYQPHLPADLGFYDLRVPEVRIAQARLAMEYGIYGFCYYHYWFSGRRVLERPVDSILASQEPDFPFCLCWANESWKRNWDNVNAGFIIEQQHTHEDDRAHIKYLLRHVFCDPRYITVSGKPVFLIYKSHLFPNMSETIQIWREEADKAGFVGLYLCRVESVIEEQGDPRCFGFDAAVEFQPDWKNLGTPLNRSLPHRLDNRFRRALRMEKKPSFQHKIYDYGRVIENMLNRDDVQYNRYPCVTPMWDNTARRKVGANIITNSTPERYAKWLATTIQRFHGESTDENFIFINAWNEWAEGNHLEPCQKWGRAYLEATREAIESSGITANKYASVQGRSS